MTLKTLSVTETLSPRTARSRHYALAAILAGAALLRLTKLGSIREPNFVPYYFAGVRSQQDSWHNFFFNAFDPAGFVSIDKPPVAFWLQTASAKLLGFDPFAVLLPQAIEGLAAITVLYALVKRRYGTTAGLLAALFLALNPISIDVDRSNNPESCLVLVLLLATGAFFNSVEKGSWRWLLLPSALVGLGFNIKMALALGLVPVFALVYLFCAPRPLRHRVGHLTAAAVLLGMVALSWCLIVDLTPASNRPFVGSSARNSMLDLAIVHNFADRLVLPTDLNAHDLHQAGPLRLVTTFPATEIAWLLPLALIGGAAAWRGAARVVRAESAVWVWWAVTYGVVFSAASGIFLDRYLTLMAPPLCALAGIGGARLWTMRAADGPAALALLAALALTALWQSYLITSFVSASLPHESGLLVLAAMLGLAVASMRLPARTRSACRVVAAAMLLTMPVASSDIAKHWYHESRGSLFSGSRRPRGGRSAFAYG